MIPAVPVRAADAAKADAKKTDAKSAPEPEAKVPDFVIPRTNGGYLSLKIDENSNFKLSFYDAKKKLMTPDVASASLRWTPVGKKQIMFVSLTPDEDGKSLVAARFIQKPWAFKLFIGLFAEGSNDPVENYIVDFSQ
ncbi:MAG TPA: hypothetical protein VMI53_06175 [Opitutaceae bacterium]|nr:hypothetical protein [Opitutaceae bacterium]